KKHGYNRRRQWIGYPYVQVKLQISTFTLRYISYGLSIYYDDAAYSTGSPSIYACATPPPSLLSLLSATRSPIVLNTRAKGFDPPPLPLCFVQPGDRCCEKPIVLNTRAKGFDPPIRPATSSSLFCPAWKPLVELWVCLRLPCKNL
ncbi:unnamed protein product, partial [Rhizoctonia solani]